MADRSAIQIFPRRDTDGRVISLAEMLFAALGGTLVGLAALAVTEGVLALTGLSRFGRGSGWLAAIMPAFLFFDDFRAWRGRGVRVLVALVAAVVAVLAGLFAAGLARGSPPIVSGAIGAMVAAIIYGPVWFVGIRWLTGTRTDMGHR